MPDSTVSTRYAFGGFLLDASQRELTREGRPVRLTPKAVSVLLALVERRGALVTHERLLADVWPGVVVEDCNLARHVATLRQALGDAADAPAFIETMPKRGYRFVAPVVELPPAEGEAAAPPAAAVPRPGAPEAPPSPPEQAAAPRRWAWAAARLPHALLALGGLAAALASGWFLVGAPAHASAPIRSLAILPVANLSGDAQQDHLAEALGEMMVNDLAHRRELQVVSRTSARHYHGSPLSAHDIGRELQVDALLEAALVRADDRVRITAELVDVRTDRLVWAEVFEGDACDFIELQGFVAGKVADALGLRASSAALGSALSPHPAPSGLACGLPSREARTGAPARH